MGDVTVGAGKSPGLGYRRDRLTWAAFSGLLAFGFLNAVLGPALPYIRAVEHVSYLVGALHQVAFAVGGGLAGLLAVRAEAIWAGGDDSLGIGGRGGRWARSRLWRRGGHHRAGGVRRELVWDLGADTGVGSVG